jgi:hypothetical protein
MSFGKTIRIYLADGTATGIRHAELVNWTGQAIVCPRGRLAELAEWSESQRPGVYLLFGDAESGRLAAYIGEAENVLLRLQSHLKTKDFWTRVVFFTSKDENLTKSHVKYLEGRLVALARAANRVELLNGNVPQLPALPRSERDAMEEFLGPVSVLLGALSFNVLQPIASEQAGDQGAAAPLSKKLLRFSVAKRPVDARGSSTDEGFVVFEGSQGDAKTRSSLGKGYRAMRDELLADGGLVIEGEASRFTRDVLFSSPSAAAAVLAGGAYNGREAWRDASGTTLKALEEQLAEAASDAPEMTTE